MVLMNDQLRALIHIAWCNMLRSVLPKLTTESEVLRVNFYFSIHPSKLL